MEFNDKITKATTHVNQNEGLIFEKSSPGKKAYKLPPLDVPEVDAEALLGEHAREDLGNMPEVSEIEIIRHFTRMSTWNYAVDYGMYPLGSCTMKYNARVNEFVARLRRPGASASLSARAHFAGRAAHHEDAAASSSSKSPAWTPSPCSPLPEPMASSPESCWCAPISSRRAIRARRFWSPTPRTAPIPRPPRCAATRSRTSSPTPPAWSTLPRSSRRSTTMSPR